MSPNQAHAMDAARHNYIMECIKDGDSYDFYYAFMIQRIKPEYHSLMIASEQEYNTYLNSTLIN